MDTYSLLRHLADSWVLLALFAVFAGAVAFAWRPGSGALHAEAGSVPFRHEDAPASPSLPSPVPSHDLAPSGPAREGRAREEAAP